MTVRLAVGDASVAIDPVAGGRLASLVLAGRERLVTREDPSALRPAITWGSFAMLPWVGRMRDGKLSWRERRVQLPLDFGAHAIHGATYDREWRVIQADATRAELELELGPSERWPFAALASQQVALAEGVLELAVEVIAGEPMPIAVGWHPWFARLEGEEVRLAVSAPAVLETLPDMIPTGAILAVDGTTDLRHGHALGDRRLDHAYVGVEAPATLAWPDLVLTIEAEPLVSIVVHSPPGSVCVEPQTAWPDAVRLAAEGHPTGLVELATGEHFVATTRWSWRSGAADG